jgi:predicted transcriptional regulator
MPTRHDIETLMAFLQAVSENGGMAPTRVQSKAGVSWEALKEMRTALEDAGLITEQPRGQDPTSRNKRNRRIREGLAVRPLPVMLQITPKGLLELEAWHSVLKGLEPNQRPPVPSW